MIPEAIELFLTERAIPFARSGNVWSINLAGESKKTIGAALALSGEGLRLESFFMRAPTENAGDVYRLVLSRNARGRLVWFAADAAGDIFLLGFVPAAALSEGTLDEMLGELLTTADQMFMAAVEKGFATYLARDLAWRAKQQQQS